MRSRLDLARIDADRRMLFSTGGWWYDAYPDLEPLDAGAAITIAAFDGPGVVDHIHVVQHIMTKVGVLVDSPPLSARGILLEVYYNGQTEPAVRAPLADFFGDGCGGSSMDFSNALFEKAPQSYNCWIPMPFEKSVRIVLRNETDVDFASYGHVEGHTLPEWDPALGYFHSTWSREAFQVSPETDRPLLHIDGTGHFVGRSWSMSTDEPLFTGFGFVMEGNNEIRIDGEAEPGIDYLGTEDSFGFSWGLSRTFAGPHNGITYLGTEPTALAVYRIHDTNPIPFRESFDLRVDWTSELTSPQFAEYLERIRATVADGGGWVDFAMTSYWYQREIGYAHARLPTLEHSTAQLLHPNGDR